MQKISRIYLANCGYDTAWYDGVMMDLREPDFHAPTDTIINLENGGGKTSFLSLVLSCFETNKDRFLKTLNDKNHRFGDYFAADGTMGLIVVEWLMPPRKAGEGSYRLLTGQAVAMRPAAEPPDERMFFSFEEDADLSLDDLPGPRLSDTPILSLSKFSDWLHEKQRLSQGNLFITRKQSDWHRHLEACLIDLPMLRMQVDFSATEGGFDKGFLGFQSEEQFLRRFLYLTMDAGRAASVRDAVAAACDKLRRRPLYLQRLTQLQTFQTSLQTFSTAATELRQERVHQLSLVWKGTRLAQALTDQSEAALASAETETQFAGAQRGVQQLQGKLAGDKAVEHATLTDWQFLRKTTQATSALKALRDAHGQAGKDVFHIKAARLQHTIKAAQQNIDELARQAELQTTELAPFLTRVQEAGSLLRRTLFDQAGSLRQQAKDLKEQIAKRQQKATDLRAEMDVRAATLKTLSTEKARLDEQQAQMDAAFARLVSMGTLQSDAEPLLEALARWDAALEQAGAELAAVLEQQIAFQEEAQGWRVLAEESTARAADCDLPRGKEQSFIQEGQRIQERLSKMSALTAAVDAERVDDLESAALRERMGQLIISYGQQVSSADVRLAQLMADKQAIENTGVAGHSADVELVVRQLRAEGIQSARAFNQYLANAGRDAERTRELVLSNPARFLGVCVADVEWDAASKVQWSATRPDKPVVISKASLAPDAGLPGVVVPAATDAAHNKDAAFELKLRLDATYNKEHEAREQLATRRDQALTARKELQEYLDRFGGGKLASAKANLQRLEAEQAEARREALAASAKEVVAQSSANALATGITDCNKRVVDCNSRSQALQQIQDEHEARRYTREQRMPVLGEELSVLEAQQADAEDTLASYQQQDLSATEQKSQLEAQASVLDGERTKLEHYDARFDAQEWLKSNAWTLDSLRQSYEIAAGIYRVNAEQRLGVIQAQLDTAKKAINAQKAEFTRDFPGVTGEELAQYRQANFDNELPAAEAQLENLSTLVETAIKAEATAKGAHTQWKVSNKVKLQTRTLEIEALDGEPLDRAIHAADAERQFALEAARRAEVAANGADQNATTAKANAKQADERKTVLTSSLALEDLSGNELLEAHLTALDCDVDALKRSFMVEADTQLQVQALVKDYAARNKDRDRSEKRARASFDALRQAAQTPEFLKAEPELAAQMRTNEFDAAVADVARLLEGLTERIAVTQANLDGMAQDFSAAADELVSLTQVAQSTLNSAMRKTIPAAAPSVGGKPILKMRSHLNAVSAENRRRVLQHYLERLIESSVIPAKGTDLAAEALMALSGKPLGLQLLKMSIDDARQYEPVAELKLSGGEAVTTAMFLYCVVSQVRSDMQAKEQRLGGGPLLLDNPFAKATKPVLWEVQLMLANAIGVQFIFATAIHDYNALGEFKHFIRLRRGSQNLKTGRKHIELVDYHLNDEAA